MKNLIIRLIAIFIITLSITSCKEEIELIGNFKETAVVYGILDQADSIHMIKITRAFIGPGNSIEIAQIPDSSYFNSVTGTVTEYNQSGTPTGRVFNLMDTLVDNKDENGIFYAPQQKLYYFLTATASPLIGTYEYKLDLDINNGEFSVHGSTPMVNGVSNNISLNQAWTFYNVNGDYLTPGLVISNAGTSYRIHTKLIVEFTEWIGPTPTIKSFDWVLGENDVLPSGNITFAATGTTFYKKMRDNCTNDPSIDKRTFNSITAVITGAAEDLVEYMKINEPSSTLAQSKPTFTNLTATENHPVVGLFSARSTTYEYRGFYDPAFPNWRVLSTYTTKQLCEGQYTGDKFFCSDHPNDVAQPFFCP